MRATREPEIPPALRRLAFVAWRRRDLIGAAVAAVAMFLAVLVSPDDFVGSGTDLVTQEFPLHELTARWVHRGVLPLWNPFSYDGAPFGVPVYLYPGWWTAFVVPGGADVKLTIALHLALAGAGGAWMCRGWTRSRLASFAGGALFATSGFFVAHLFAGHRNMVVTASYLPWLVGIAHRAWRGDRVQWGPAATIVALAALSASYPLVAIDLLAAAILVGADALAAPIAWRDRAAKLGRAAWVTAALVAIGALVGAIQWLPVQGFLPFTQRAATDAAFASSGASVPGDLATFALPRLFGDGADVPFVGGFQFWECFGYVGVVTIALAAVAIAAGAPRRWAAGLVAVAAGVLLSLGPSTPLFRALTAVAPPLARFRSPGRYVLVAAAGAAILAAMGIDAIVARRANRSRARLVAPAAIATALMAAALLFVSRATPESLARFAASIAPLAADVAPGAWRAILDASRADATRAVVLLLGATIAIAFAASDRPRRVRARAAWLVALFAITDTIAAAQPLLVTAPHDAFEWPAPLVAHCRELAGLGGRVLSTPELHSPNAGALYDFGQPVGYTTFFDERYARFVNRAEDAPLDRFVSFVVSAGDSPLMRHLGVRAIVTTLPLADARGVARLGMGSFHRVAHMGPVQVLAADDPSPRVALVHATELVASEDAAYARMIDPAFDVRRVALVESPPRFAPAAPPDGAREEARLAAYEPNFAAIDVDAASDAVLVMSDALEGGWTATVDGAPAPMFDANRVMRGLAVHAGKHRVEMRYRPPLFAPGAALSLLGLAAVLAAWLLPRRRR